MNYEEKAAELINKLKESLNNDSEQIKEHLTKFIEIIDSKESRKYFGSIGEFWKHLDISISEKAYNKMEAHLRKLEDTFSRDREISLESFADAISKIVYTVAKDETFLRSLKAVKKKVKKPFKPFRKAAEKYISKWSGQLEDIVDKVKQYPEVEKTTMTFVEFLQSEGIDPSWFVREATAYFISEDMKKWISGAFRWDNCKLAERRKGWWDSERPGKRKPDTSETSGEILQRAHNRLGQLIDEGKIKGSGFTDVQKEMIEFLNPFNQIKTSGE